MSTRNLLVELFVEELPPKALNKLGEAFSGVLAESLKASGLLADSSAVTTFASPRRLAAHITDVAAKAADKQVAQKLMPATVGLDASGNATPALLKKLQALGENESAVARLRKENDGKADILFLDATQSGANLQEGLQKALDETLAKLPIPKVMTYQINDGWQSVNFVRPAHGLVALHGDEIIPVSTLGLTASNTTLGHRFEAKNPVVTLSSADTYAQQLADEGAVIASFADRRAEIVKQLQAAAAKENLKPIEDDALLDEVTALVERPNVLLGQFEEEFLAVPQECLILTMKANQKYFPLLNANGKLTNKFLIVSNINPADASKVIGGNERVVRPRLADAKFFFDQDRKKTLDSRLPGLSKVVYHNKLGSQGERNERVVAIASVIAQQIGGDGFVAKVAQAARLSKVDLLTDMVGEFPELQGIMGRYYAQHEGLADDVAYAIEDHYRPRFAGDDLPRSQVGVVVALADKLETLVGLFSIGEKPTGDKDPFALRRQALGILRMLMETELPLAFDKLIAQTLTVFNGNADVAEAIQAFCFDRLAVNLRDQGASALEVDAVLSLSPNQLAEVPRRLAAVQAFANLPEAPALAAANKRVSNILKKVEGEVTAEVNSSLLQEPAEKALHQALANTKPKADQLFETGDYAASLQALAALKAPVDRFFEDVMVNAEDPALKANRLGLLATLHQAMNRVADLSKLAS
ncbi:glycine--tRNA ligase subunit beta [Methylophilus sp. Leaf414]|uniref:glycine--tRNA ligase subunit beta n=1 Tax=Methylophilus sp. Leaf414 TaxID=1736371 RepID=UPI0006FDCF3C|nr:glycine--tRNA ligase subunit beta [Methylophilus sp. Leaf414]KQT36242.1 glycine--tRNA ligase subunit beta [Methylophilus sp. Leaf414]